MTGAPLDADGIVDATIKEYGLQEYDDPGVRQRFAALIASFNDTGRLDEIDRPRALAQLSKIVRTRLELARDWSEHPEIAGERVDRPFFVVGAGRTGTTLMQVLLSLGDGCRTPLSWETRNPSPPPGFAPETESDRIAVEQSHIEDMINLAPGFLLSHPYIDQGAYMEVEDQDIVALDFHTAFPFHYTRVPVAPIVHHHRETGLTEALRFHRRVLQHLQWRRPTEHWVCKTAEFYFELPAYFDVYPDATVVWTHRDPVQFIPSVLGIIEHFYLPHSGIRLRGDYAAQIVAGLEQGYQAILGSDWVDDDRIVHVRFEDFVADQTGTIERIYERRGTTVSAGYAERISNWLADPRNRSDRHGRFRYSCEQFGLDPGDIATRFAAYYDKFLEA